MAVAERPLYAGLPQPAPVATPGRLQAIRARHRFFRGLATLACAGALLLGETVAAAAVARAGYQLDQMQSQLVAAEARHRQLQIEVEGLRSLPRVDQLASKLGLQQPPSYATVPVVAVHDTLPVAGHEAVIALGPGPAAAPAQSVWRVWAAAAGRLVASQAFRR